MWHFLHKFLQHSYKNISKRRRLRRKRFIARKKLSDRLYKMFENDQYEAAYDTLTRTFTRLLVMSISAEVRRHRNA